MRRARQEADRLLSAARQAREESEMRVADVEALMWANRELAHSVSLETLLPLLARLARALVNAEGATFVLREGDHVRYAAEDAVAPLWLGRSFRAEECISGWAIRERSCAVIEDVYSDSRIPREAYLPTFVKSVVMVPVRRDDPFGAMGVYWADRHKASERELRLIEALADAAAIAVANARLFAELEAARSRAENENRAKDEFLAMLSHELRNPLAAVRNAVTTASLDDSLRERALAIARRQADQLGRLIDDLLDVARITQGRITLRNEHVYLYDVMTSAVASSRAFIESRGHQLRVSDLSDGVRVEGDPARLEQVIVNLLNNAAKYTEPGGKIDIVIERARGEAVLRVRDTGIGLAPELLPQVFDLFTQADRSLDRVHGGLGIGLTISRRLVLMHGGRIEAHSAGLGKGSEFVVCLPALGSAAEDGRRERQPAGTDGAHAPARVLIVEDNPDAAESLRMLLELLGHRVRVAPEGLAALEAAHASPPEIMLIDIGLPGMDGYELAHRLRADSTLSGLVLVALTGYGRDEDKARSLAAGFDFHLVKPVNVAALESLLLALRKDSAARSSPALH
jgi:signal transduction histidine kinase/ActR/RegA family two-component response regulator